MCVFIRHHKKNIRKEGEAGNQGKVVERKGGKGKGEQAENEKEVGKGLGWILYCSIAHLCTTLFCKLTSARASQSTWTT